MLNDGIVRDTGSIRIRRRHTPEKEWPLEYMPPPKGVILFDNSGVDKGEEEERRKQAKAKTNTD
jgi:hypothetical protein